jgi:hypothetical protein
MLNTEQIAGSDLSAIAINEVVRYGTIDDMRNTLESLLDLMRDNEWQSYEELTLKLADLKSSLEDAEYKLWCIETGKED